MERMFPEPKEFVEVTTYVIKDAKGPYDRYVNTKSNKYSGLLAATRFTKEELEKITLKENEIAIEYNKLFTPNKK